ncbi:MAG: hypothetical protein QHJ73_20000, partial [Armatimonadota bacterium]|nr:hypothetical protein [Armatimonadota bacterium]
MKARQEPNLLETLANLARAAAGGAGVDALCAEVAEGARSCFAAEGARVALQDAPARPLRVVARAGVVPPGVWPPSDAEMFFPGGPREEQCRLLTSDALSALG